MRKINGPWNKTTGEILGNELELLSHRLENLSSKDIIKVLEPSLKAMANSVWTSARKEFERNPMDSLGNMFSSYSKEVTFPKEEIISIIEEILEDRYGLEPVEDK